MKVTDLEKPYKDLEKDIKETGHDAMGPIMGIYYDDPGNLVDDSKFRASMGILVKNRDSDFLYKMKEKGYEFA